MYINYVQRNYVIRVSPRLFILLYLLAHRRKKIGHHWTTAGTRCPTDFRFRSRKAPNGIAAALELVAFSSSSDFLLKNLRYQHGKQYMRYDNLLIIVRNGCYLLYRIRGIPVD